MKIDKEDSGTTCLIIILANGMIFFIGQTFLIMKFVYLIEHVNSFDILLKFLHLKLY